MGWANSYIESLKRGETVTFRPTGHSMTGIINSRDLCVIQPLRERVLQKGDVVLCKVRGMQYLHLVSAVRGEGYKISNNKGHDNGWINRQAIYGICTSVNGKSLL